MDIPERSAVWKVSLSVSKFIHGLKLQQDPLPQKEITETKQKPNDKKEKRKKEHKWKTTQKNKQIYDNNEKVVAVNLFIYTVLVNLWCVTLFHVLVNPNCNRISTVFFITIIF